MNKKRWIAVAIAALILAIAIVTPAYETIEEEQAREVMSNLGIGNFMGDEPTEEILEEGDSSNRIAVVSLEGNIMSKATYGPGYKHEDLLEQLRNLSEDESVKGVLFILNTGGGTMFGSEEIRQEIINLKEAGKPVYGAMYTMAASGGYYIAAETDKIYAYPDTVTGSIGVVVTSVDPSGLYEKLGIEVTQYTAGDLKRITDDDDKATKEEHDKVQQDYVDEGYERFVDVIVQGRGMDKAKVKKLADGRIYTANQALELDLIDELGSIEDALAGLKADHGLEGAQVFKFKYADPGAFPVLNPFASQANPMDLVRELYHLEPLAGPRLYSIIDGGE